MGANNHITDAKIILFLGAGASKPLGKWLMHEFVEKLLEHRLIKDAPFERMLGKLIELARHDLERLLEKIDVICSEEYGHRSMGDFAGVRASVEAGLIQSAMRLSSESTRTDPGDWLVDFSQYYATMVEDCLRLRKIIEDIIFEHYGEIDGNAATALYSNFLRSLKEYSPVLPVFTTNYDQAIENYVEHGKDEYRIVNGFRPSALLDQIYEPRTYDSFAPEKNSCHIVLFKLHGSVFWFQDKDGRIKYNPIPQPLRNEMRKSVLIYPATRKIALEDPFFTAYDYLQRCLDGTSLAIFIGYSFRDYDALTKIKSALKFNDKLRLIVLNPKADKLIEVRFSDLSELEAIRISPFNYRFGNSEDEQKYLPEITSKLRDWLEA